MPASDTGGAFTTTTERENEETIGQDSGGGDRPGRAGRLRRHASGPEQVRVPARHRRPLRLGSRTRRTAPWPARATASLFPTRPGGPATPGRDGKAMKG